MSNKIREELRQREFSNWCKLKQKGRGAILFNDCPKINKSLFNKKALTKSEWTTYFKMVGNVAARSTGTNRCRIPRDRNPSVGSCKIYNNHIYAPQKAKT